MTGLLLRWGLNAISLLVIAHIIEGVTVEGFGSALVAVLVLGIVNALIRPIILLLTLPINIMTIGLFTFIINGLMLYMVASVVVGFSIDGFIPALIGTIILSVFSTIVNKLFR
ncbi:MAG: phage holin family protein [Bacillota bacterium]|nr:phage holin family protein [Bacillota bacterium]